MCGRLALDSVVLIVLNIWYLWVGLFCLLVVCLLVFGCLLGCC